jgi:dihydropyrimidinase
VWAETCPQYLFLTEDAMRPRGVDGAKFVCSPPLRTATDVDALWSGLRSGDLQVVATDHCPFRMDQKALGAGDFRRVPNGLPGVEDRFTLLYEGVVRGQYDVSRWVDLVATTPARVFGLHPRKGTIAPGSDADLVVFDPTRERVLSAATHHMNVDYSPYEGRCVRGVVDVVMQRGEVLVAHGKFQGRPGAGRFLPRAVRS